MEVQQQTSQPPEYQGKEERERQGSAPKRPEEPLVLSTAGSSRCTVAATEKLPKGAAEGYRTTRLQMELEK
jgi:hypothetical protein